MSKSKFNTKIFGDLRICLDNTLIAEVFRFVFNNLKDLNYKNSLIALNGLLAAEGGAQIDSVGLHKISLTLNKKEKKLFDKVLYKTDLLYLFKFVQDKRYKLNKWEYQHKFLERFLENNLIPFNLHFHRSKNAIHGFLAHSFTQTLIKYLNVLKNKKIYSIKEISKQLNHRQDSILSTIKKERYQRYIKIKRKKDRYNTYIISINNKGVKFLKLIDELKLQLKQMEENMKEELPFEKIKRKLLIKKEAETSEEFGKRPEDRTVPELLNYGVINLNKPSGPTSHQTVDYIKQILEIPKAGHSGTLDPNVTGCLPIFLSKATKGTQILLKTGKEYIALMHLHKPVSPSNIQKIFKNFQGKIKQIPPLKSAVKRQERTREIYYLKILEIKNQDILFKVGCEAGTYIRTLCVQIGKALNTNAHMSQLIRTKAGPFNDKEWYSLHDIKDAYEFFKEGNEKEIKKIIKLIEYSIEPLPKIYILDSTVDTIAHGAKLSIPGISKLNEFEKNELIAILTLKGELVALGTSLLSSKEIIEKDKGLAVKTDTVFMPRNIYPKFKLSHN